VCLSSCCAVGEFLLASGWGSYRAGGADGAFGREDRSRAPGHNDTQKRNCIGQEQIDTKAAMFSTLRMLHVRWQTRNWLLLAYCASLSTQYQYPHLTAFATHLIRIEKRSKLHNPASPQHTTINSTHSCSVSLQIRLHITFRTRGQKVISQLVPLFS